MEFRTISEMFLNTTNEFSSKPLYYYISNNKAIFSSLPSPIESIFNKYYKFSPNTIRKTSLKYLNESSFLISPISSLNIE